MDIYKREVQRNPNNVHVVYYQSVKHAIHSYGKSTRFGGTDIFICNNKEWHAINIECVSIFRFVFAPVAPFNFVDNIVYFDLRRFADVIVGMFNFVIESMSTAICYRTKQSAPISEVPEGTTKARITKPDVFTDKISYIVVPLFYALHKAMQVTFHVS